MTFTEAIKRIKNGDASAFSYLYDATKEVQYHSLLKKGLTSEDAEDVLQIAYAKAWEKLDTLTEPEYFRTWFGTIVNHTMLNELDKKKKNTYNFSDLSSENEDGEEWEYEAEDLSTDHQPELAYTEAEQKEILESLLNSLSQEERAIILMRYYEEMKFKDIAEALSINENTVKTKERAARGKLEKQSKELEKKGYKLYSVAPITLLFWLLKKEAPVYAAEIPAFSESAAASAVLHGAQTGAHGAAFFTTIGGKLTIAVAGLAVAGGITTGLIALAQNQKVDSEPTYVASVQTETDDTLAGASATSTETEEMEDTETDVDDTPVMVCTRFEEYAGDSLSQYCLYTYDEKGRIQTEEIVHPGDSEGNDLESRHTISYVYDEDGLLIEENIENLYADGFIETTYYYYDENGILSGKETHIPGGEEVYTYDEQGNILTESCYSEDHVWTSTEYHSYDAAGREYYCAQETSDGTRVIYDGTLNDCGLIATMTKTVGGYYSEYEYDEEGNLSCEKNFDEEGNLLEMSTYTYDEDGRCIIEDYTNSYGTNHVVWEYSADGLILKQTECWNDSDLLCISSFTYDEYGNLLDSLYSEGDTVYWHDIYYYEALE